MLFLLLVNKLYKRRLTGYTLCQVNELRKMIYYNIVFSMHPFLEIANANSNIQMRD